MSCFNHVCFVLPFFISSSVVVASGNTLDEMEFSSNVFASAASSEETSTPFGGHEEEEEDLTQETRFETPREAGNEEDWEEEEGRER